MRSYIFTKHEREVLEAYVEKNDKKNGLAVFLHRIRNAKRLNEDMKLINQLQEKEAK